MYVLTYDVEDPIMLQNLKTGSYNLRWDSAMKSIGEHANPNGITSTARWRKDLFEPHIEPNYKISVDGQ